MIVNGGREPPLFAALALVITALYLYALSGMPSERRIAARILDGFPRVRDATQPAATAHLSGSNGLGTRNRP